MCSLRKSLIAAILLASTPTSAFTLQEAYALKGSGKVAAELWLQASGAPQGGVTVAALAQPGQAERLLADLRHLGIEHDAAAGRLVTGRLPYAAVGKLDPLASLHSIRPSPALFQAADPGAGRQGSIVSKGDAEMYAAAARTRFQVDGSGVTVGVLSDSYDCGGDEYRSAAATLQTGDIPPDVRVLADPCVVGYTDEGRALLEVVHDLAPGAALAFHTAANGAADMAQGIRALAEAGATVIVDDTVYLDEPVYQDGGPIADAVREVVSRGVAYVAAAGNFGRNTYEAPFRSSGVTVTVPGQVKEWKMTWGSGPNGQLKAGEKYGDLQRVTTPARIVELHDFDPGPGVDTCQKITITQGGRMAFALHWDQPYASIGGGQGAASDLDLFLMDANCQQVYQSPDALGDPRVAASQLTATLFGVAATDNVGGDPVETLVTFTPTLTGITDVARTYGIAVGRSAGPSPSRFRLTYASGAMRDHFPLTTAYPRSYPPYEGYGWWRPVPEIFEYTQDSPGIFGHANLPDVVTVGTVRAKTYRTAGAAGRGDIINAAVHQTEAFSALGGTELLFDAQGQLLDQPIQRRKPDLAGLDGVEHFSQLGGGWDGVGYGFYGTSAAAAHVGGLVALARQAAPAATPARIAEALRATALDLDDTLTPSVDKGFDFATGYGLADGENLIARLLAQPEMPRAGAGGGDNNGNRSGIDCGQPTATAQPGKVLRGTRGNDVLLGSDAADRIQGLRGDDTLCGGAGNDRLLGGPGNDVLVGGPGDDVLKGGPGNDVFRFSGNSATGRDRILDFGPGDVIEIVGRPDANGDGRIDAGDVLVRDTAAGAVITGLQPAPGEMIVVRGRTAAQVSKALRVLP